MPAATLTSKGQITLPRTIRRKLGARAGDRVAFRERKAIVVEAETMDLMDLCGIVRPRVRGVTTGSNKAMIALDTNVLVRFLKALLCLFFGILFVFAASGCRFHAIDIENVDGGEGDGCLGAGENFLHIVGDSSRTLLPGVQEELQVVFTKKCVGAVTGEEISFEFIGNAGDSSLSSDSAVTNDDGMAAVTLTTGSQDSQFQVRAHNPKVSSGVHFSIQVTRVWRQLNPVGPTDLRVFVNESIELRVRLVEVGTNELVSGVEIGFAIVQPLPGNASIEESMDTTDQSGLASAVFFAGTTVASYRVVAEGVSEDVGKVTFNIQVQGGQECQSDEDCSTGHCEVGWCVSDPCEPETCVSLDKECGRWEDDCGGLLECGECEDGRHCEDGTCMCSSHASRDCLQDDVWWFDSCGNPEERIVDCQYGCEAGECLNCTPECAGKECGDDGCGGDCGTCTPPETCGGGGTPNVCGEGACTPATCAQEGANCGTIPDGCGNTLNCGSCTPPETCGGGGTPNVCGCTPTTEICDNADNDCDGEIDENLSRACLNACGNGTETCSNGSWVNCTAPQPQPEVCDGLDNDCNGSVDDNLSRQCSTACGTGSETCQNGQWVNCTAPQPPQPEVCQEPYNTYGGVGLHGMSFDSFMANPVPGITALVMNLNASQVAQAHAAGYKVVEWVGTDPSMCDDTAATGADVLIVDEMAWQLGGNFNEAAIRFNQCKSLAQAVNPDIVVGDVEPFFSYLQSFLDAGADPDFVGGETYNGDIDLGDLLWFKYTYNVEIHQWAHGVGQENGSNGVGQELDFVGEVSLFIFADVYGDWDCMNQPCGPYLDDLRAAGSEGYLQLPYIFSWKGYTWHAMLRDAGQSCYVLPNLSHLPSRVDLEIQWVPSEGAYCSSRIQLAEYLGPGRYLVKTGQLASLAPYRTGLFEQHALFLGADYGNSYTNSQYYDPDLVGLADDARFVAYHQSWQWGPGALHGYWYDLGCSTGEYCLSFLHQILWIPQDDFVEFGEWKDDNGWVLTKAFNHTSSNISDRPMRFIVSLEVHKQSNAFDGLVTSITGFCFSPDYGWCGP